MTKCRRENKFLLSNYKGDKQEFIYTNYCEISVKKKYYVNTYLPDDREIMKL